MRVGLGSLLHTEQRGLGPGNCVDPCENTMLGAFKRAVANLDV
jgi:hypothetical protein